MSLNFKIQNQQLKQIGETKPANLSQEYLELDIDFKTDDWNGLTKFGLFTDTNGLKYRVALTDDKVIVPNAVLQYNKFTFSIYGVKDDVRVTTNQLTIYLKDSGYVRDVENDIPDDDPTIVEEIYEALDGKASLVHTHAKSDITDFSHTHTKADVTDFSHTHFKSEINDFNHTHIKSEITDFAHNHDDRYYTESEVDAIVENLKNELNNRVVLKGDKPIIQTGDTMDFTAYAVQEGMPVLNKKVHFYEIMED